MQELTLYYWNVVVLLWRLDSCLSSGVGARDVSCTSVRDRVCALLELGVFLLYEMVTAQL